MRHGYLKQWLDWPYSSAREFLAGIGREKAERLWREYPLADYGRDWDEPWM